MLNNTQEWQALVEHCAEVSNSSMRDLFSHDDKRFANYSMQIGGLLVDYSKHRITENTLPLLFDLAKAAQLDEKKQAMFRGDPINISEGRSVLHTALRMPATETLDYKGTNSFREFRMSVFFLA